ncbi:MAG: hypothetical protein LQ342_006027 [Letrouitia transgressa]|nr:MAG: hypothetical protein LQ342_006027 [Letrouitia transgressa]
MPTKTYTTNATRLSSKGMIPRILLVDVQPFGLLITASRPSITNDFPVIQPVENTTTIQSTSYQTATIIITPTPVAEPTTSSASASEVHSNAPIQAAAHPAPPPPKKHAAPPAEHKSQPRPHHGPKSPPSSHHSKPPTTGGNQWAMTYSPYTSSGGCKSPSDVSSDVATIAAKGFSSIRLYSTDCSSLTAGASAARSHHLKIVLGVYISDSGISVARPQIHDIVSWAAGNWEGVEMIVIGNEAVFNQFCSAAELASFISEAKTAFVAAGYTGPVTTTETVASLTENADTLCPVMDIAAANVHPFFNPTVSAETAGPFVASQLELLKTVCPGKEDVLNLETGWPSRGSNNGQAVPGTWEQEVAIKGIKEHAGGKSAFFSWVDDGWKEEGEWGVERWFGCGQLFGE